ncbi:MAG: hypothetical protein NTY19_24010 [Planctomycetota bacterium]|nr:hypothetical protein [Planctomycetota bacterium]
MLINHLSLNAFSGWCKCVGGLASFAETPQSDPVPDGWAPHYRDEINLGYQDILKWAESLNGQPWPPGAKMTRAELVGAIELLHGDALQLVTVLQNSDCWGIRYSAWPCVADRELVDRVRHSVADLSQLIVFLSALAIDQEQRPEVVAVASEAVAKVVVGWFTGQPAKVKTPEAVVDMQSKTAITELFPDQIPTFSKLRALLKRHPEITVDDSKPTRNLVDALGVTRALIQERVGEIPDKQLDSYLAGIAKTTAEIDRKKGRK